MRVLLCHNNFRVTGGADVFYHEAARVLRENGHDVAMLSCAEEGLDTEWERYFPEAVDYAGGGARALLRFDKLVYSRPARRAVERLVDDFRPDLAHCFSIYTKLTPSILDGLGGRGVPTVCSFNDYKHICPNYKLFHHGHVCEDCHGKHFFHAVKNRCSHDSVRYSVAKTIEAYAHSWLGVYRRNVNTFLFASEFMAKKTENFWGPGTFRWRTLRNPFDSPAHELSEGYGDFALFFGRLIEEKGVDVLLRAMAHCPTARLVVVGEGPQEEELRGLTRELDLDRVEFVGPKWGPELDVYLKQARFVVVPSIWHENFPYVIFQAFAVGKAVVGTDRGGIPELVADGRFGLVYPAQDERRLAACMEELWNDPAACVEMGRAAKAYADEEFNDDRFYEELMSIYGEVLA